MEDKVDVEVIDVASRIIGIWVEEPELLESELDRIVVSFRAVFGIGRSERFAGDEVVTTVLMARLESDLVEDEAPLMTGQPIVFVVRIRRVQQGLLLLSLAHQSKSEAQRHSNTSEESNHEE